MRMACVVTPVKDTANDTVMHAKTSLLFVALCSSLAFIHPAFLAFA